ncbi:TPA: endonuclease [Candidatus Micrarchaeota archaeon]|nr:endonuclease [Candidatus Micrarchaeota archaeon]
MDKRVIAAYKKLLAQFGSQFWWPADSDYEVVVGAILTQNTNWRNVEKAISNLRAAHKLNEKAILEIGNSELETLIRPSGFYKQKAARLKLATRKWMELSRRADRMPIADLRAELLSVKGIGKETADSIILYAFHKPIFVIDAYTRRFCKKFFDVEFRKQDYDEYRKLFESALPPDVALFKEYHALIVEWGKNNGN